MRFLLVSLSVFFIACHSLSEQDQLRHNLEGTWIVLLADHQLQNDDQELIYGRIQDSVVSAKSLKLVMFFKNGDFQQLDKPGQQGKWAVSPARQLYIAKGGAGFEDFKADFLQYEDKTLQVIEYLNVENQKIKLTWYLKKIKRPSLFDDANNAWRKKAGRMESETEIRQRLSAMFAYYSDYFDLVAKESSFFIGQRVMLPLRFYQHAMGTSAFDPQSEFAALFFNREQAEQAYGYVKKTVYDLGDKYPEGENFVTEYSLFMDIVAKKIRAGRDQF